jgi:hypothetical protein
MPGSARDLPPEYDAAMRFNLKSISVMVAVLGCMLFPFGGFMLFPVAFDMWEHGASDKAA